MDRTHSKPLAILACPSELAAGKMGSSQGVSLLIQYCIKPLFPDAPLWITPTQNNPNNGKSFPQAKHIEQVCNNLSQVYHLLYKTYSEGFFTLNITADHSNAAGTFSAFSDHYGAENSGLIWIDAHADMHSPFTTPSGNIHGMPLAALMGMDNLSESNKALEATEEVALIEWWNRLKDVGLSGKNPKLLPQNLVIIGLRDMEEEEVALLENLSIKYVKPEELREKGAALIAKEVFHYLSNCSALYCSFDIDSLDKSIVPATGTPVDNGLTLAESEVLLGAIWSEPRLASFAVTEFNPSLESGDSTLKSVSAMLTKVFTS